MEVVDESRDSFARAALIAFFSEPQIPPALPPTQEEAAPKIGAGRARKRGVGRRGGARSASRKSAALARAI